MMTSLEELRANPPKSTGDERALTVCLAPNLVAEVQSLTDELATLPAPPSANDDEPSGPPKRSGQGEHPRSKEIRERLADVIDEMARLEGELRVRVADEGEWRRWANEHPAREAGEPGHKRDREVTAGYCNADDLIDDLAKYAYSWNGKPLEEGDWETLFKPNMGGSQLKKAAREVVASVELSLDFQQWRSGLSTTLHRLNASASPASSRSARGGSTAGSRPRSSAATTKKATKSPSAKPGK